MLAVFILTIYIYHYLSGAKSLELASDVQNV